MLSSLFLPTQSACSSTRGKRINSSGELHTANKFCPTNRIILRPLRVQNVAVGADADELVGRGDGVQVGVLAVVEDGVRMPDLLEDRDAEGHVLERVVHGQTFVVPRLAEVAVHRVHLQHKQEE